MRSVHVSLISLSKLCCSRSFFILLFFTFFFLFQQSAFAHDNGSDCHVKFVGVSENGVNGYDIKGLTRPGKTAIFKFADWSPACGNHVQIEIMGSRGLDDHSHGNETAHAPVNYNDLFGIGSVLPLVCQDSNCTFSLTTPNQTGFFNVNLIFKNGNTILQEFHDIPFELSCSDGVYCNGEEKLIKGVCQAPNAKEVLPPCNQLLNTGNPPLAGATGPGCESGSCKCFPCNEENKTCSQFPQRAHEAAGGDVSEAALVQAYTATCGKGDPRNYCAYACTPNCGQGSKARVCGPDGCGGTCGPACSDGKTCNALGQCVVGVPTPGSCSLPNSLFDKTLQASASGIIAPDPKFVPQGSTSLESMTREQKLAALEALTSNGTAPVNVPVTGAALTIYGNNKGGGDDVTPSCNSPGVPEIIYKFVIRDDILPGRPDAEKFQGFAALILDENGNPAALDTLIALNGGPGGDCLKEYKSPAATDVMCSDDAVPPGGFGSHIYGALPPGTYYLVATSYATQAAGPYQIVLKFADASGNPNGNGSAVCRPTTCTNRTCGTDECKIGVGGTLTDPLFDFGRCGFADCPSGFVCSSAIGQCKAADCPLPTDANYLTYPYDCKNRQCGTDGGNCGFSCGTCADGKVCNFDTNKCIPVKACDPNAPVCSGNKQSPHHYCGYDCQWHKSTEHKFDIIPSTEGEVVPSMIFQHINLPLSAVEGSCAVQEGCLLDPNKYNTGAEQVIGDTHYVLRFTTNVHNLSPLVGFKPESPRKRPDLFEFSPCHGHFHFAGFARFNLLDAKRLADGDHTPVIRGGKLAYCMEDTLQYSFSPMIECLGSSSCDNQGIQAGWTDRYPADLDCQWIDLSLLVHAHQKAVEEGIAQNKTLDKWYAYEACVNTDRNFVESSYDNNCTTFLVYLPEELVTNPVFHYTSWMENSENRAKACGTVESPNAQLEELGLSAEAAKPCICRGDCKDVTLFDAFGATP